MFSVGGERCLVDLFKQFVERRPLNMRWSGPFYLSIKRNRRLNDNIWFKSQPMRVNIISNMMKTTVAGTIALKKVAKSLRITVLERQQSASWRKQTLNVQILWRSEATEACIPCRLRWTRRRRATTTLQCNIQMKLWKLQCWEKANGSFRHHNNCGSTLFGKHEHVPVPHALASPSMTASKEN